MAVPFPDLSPVSRSFSPGRWPIKRFTAINGSSTTRIYGDKATEASLELQFLVDDAAMKSIMDCYDSANGAYEDVALSQSMFDGLSKTVFPDYLKFHWVEAPIVSSVQPDLSQVTVKLIGLLEA